MEVPQIDKIQMPVSVNTEEAGERQKVSASEPEIKKCIYNKEKECTAPDCKMDACAKCPYGNEATLASTVKDVFKKIVNIAIFIAKSDDVMRDVISMISKGGIPEEGSVSRNEQKEPEIKEELVAERAMLKIKPVKAEPIRPELASIQDQMSAQVAVKAKGLSEALANPDGKPAGRLV